MKYKIINKADNVAVAMQEIKQGDIIEINKDSSIEILQDIPKSHKFSIAKIDKNNDIIKYGYSIGKATKDINKGEFVHTHNLISTPKDNFSNFEKQSISYGDNKITRKLTGYRRNNNKVGIRNDIWIIPTVGCVNSVCNNLAKMYVNSTVKVKAFNHPYGCSQTGEDFINTQKALISMIEHPNCGGVLLIGLGCENNQLINILNGADYEEKRLRSFNTQEIEDEMTLGQKYIDQLIDIVNKDARTEISFSDLKIGLECGGSDGYSGITANPLIGDFSDIAIENNAQVIITEIPEFFGAEYEFSKRAIDVNTYNEFVDSVNSFKKYYTDNNEKIDKNPSPGNKEGGITTLAEKSLGCVQKSGRYHFLDVIEYTQKSDKKGLVVLNAPGNDLIATSALGFSDCNLVLFSTGRGTPYGGFVPTFKISTNSSLYELKKNWMDFDAQKYLFEPKETLDEFIDNICDIINGELTKNETNNFEEIAIFKTGVTL